MEKCDFLQEALKLCVMEEIVEHLNVSVGFCIIRTELPNLKSLIFSELFK
jgi:hypothetical protein